jgi:hypothetical protein
MTAVRADAKVSLELVVAIVGAAGRTRVGVAFGVAWVQFRLLVLD